MRCDKYVRFVYPKIGEEMQKVKNIILTNDEALVLFSQLADHTIQSLVDAFSSLEVEKGHCPIVQGSHGVWFYIVEPGCFDLFVLVGTTL